MKGFGALAGPEVSEVLNKITIRGIVQGVGFRPFVFNLAERLDINGWVLNNSAGVEIEAEGEPSIRKTADARFLLPFGGGCGSR